MLAAVRERYKDTFVAVVLLSYFATSSNEDEDSYFSLSNLDYMLYDVSTMIASPIMLLKLVQIFIRVLIKIN